MPDSGSECCLGDSEDLEEHVATLRLCTEQLGPCHPRTLTAANRLAVAFWLAGYTDQAVGLLDHALEFVASTPGSDYPQRVDLLSTLGEILLEQRHLEPAEAIQREVMEHRIRHSGPNHSAALEAKGDPAPMLYELGRDDEAARLEQEAFEGARAHFGRAHTVTCVLVWNRAMSCERCRDSDSARSIFVNELAWLLGTEPACLEPAQHTIRTFLERRLNWAQSDHMLTSNCPPSWEMLGAYVDGEFDNFAPDAPWSHIAGCPICSQACAQIRDQGSLIRSLAPYHAVSRRLRKAVSEIVHS